MRTLPRGNAWRLLGRVASGMTMLVSQFQAPTKPGLVAFTPQLPGRILSLELSPGHNYILQRHCGIDVGPQDQAARLTAGAWPERPRALRLA